MEHAIALAYLISCLLLAASFPIVLIRKNQNGTEDVFFAHIQGFLLLLLLALLFNMMLHYYQTVFAPAQRDTPLMLCNLLCDLCVFSGLKCSAVLSQAGWEVWCESCAACI